MCGVSDGEKDRLQYPRKEHEIFLEGPRGLCGELELEFDCCFSGVKEEFLGRHCQGQEERYRKKSRRGNFTHSPEY